MSKGDEHAHNDMPESMERAANTIANKGKPIAFIMTIALPREGGELLGVLFVRITSG